MTAFTILSENEYFEELIQAIKRAKAGNRIALMSMSFDHTETYPHTVLLELAEAAKRGVSVDLVVDAYSFILDTHGLPTGPLIYRRTMAPTRRAHFNGKLAMLEQLRESGGRYYIINTPFSSFTNPMAKRSHIKATVINNTVYIGGCNLEGSWQIDLMVRIADKPTSEWVYELIQNVASQGSTYAALQFTDRTFTIGPKTTLLVDSGKSKQSLIFDNALELIDHADTWLLMTCQYFPNSETAKHLAAAHRRGVNVCLLYNHPNKQMHVLKAIYRLVLLQERAKHPKTLFMYQLPRKHRRLHAKLIATDKGAIIGSHNYVTTGIRFGTAEIAVVRHDQEFAKQAVGAIRRYIVFPDLF